MKNFKKIAIIHDWLVVDGGAERVLRDILDLYPDADIYGLVDFLSPNDRQNLLDGRYAKTSFIQNLPLAKKYFRHYLPLFPKAIESLDFSGYDLIISSSWAVAKGICKDKDQLHICYCHTPVRYAWDLYEEYTSNLKGVKKLLVQWTLNRLRKWDLKTAKRVDYFIANSYFVANRIEKTYQRHADVIYPPVNMDKFSLQKKKEEFYITASRLVPYKKTRLIVEAFNKMPDKQLVVIGAGEDFDYIQKIAKSNIKILGYQSDEVLIDHMQRAKAFVYAAVEDFGIIVLESLSCGTPVIALDKGGTSETVSDSLNGIHFQEQNIDDIISAIKRFESSDFDPQAVRQSVEKYTHFKEQFKTFVEKVTENYSVKTMV